MNRSYLTIAETADMLGVARQTVRRRVYSGLLPSLWLGPRLIRVEARCIVQDAPPPVQSWPAAIGVGDLASAWRLHPRTIHALAGAGLIPGHRVHGQWAFRPRELAELVRRLTTGSREAA